jgi:uncharacterized membrane protein YccC
MPVEPSQLDSKSVADSANQQPAGPWQSFWRLVVRFDASKITPGIALRNTVGIAVPLIVGVAIGSPLGAVAVATGALNVAYSDGSDAYRQRATRMLASCILTSAAVFLGGLAGKHHVAVAIAAAVAAFAAGLVVALGPAASDLGVITLVTFIVYSLQSLSVRQACYASALAFSGGLLQTVLALIFWPVCRYEPEKRLLAQFYSQLSALARTRTGSAEAPPGSASSTQARLGLSAIERDRTLEGNRYHSLLNQAERIRLCLHILSRLRRRIERDIGGASFALLLNDLLVSSAAVLSSISNILAGNDSAELARDQASQVGSVAEVLREQELKGLAPFLNALVRDAQFQADALIGQLRAAVDLADHAMPKGNLLFERKEAAKPLNLRVANRLAVLRANLTLRSTAFRHAIRLAVCVALGEMAGHALGWRRSYWLPMTVAIVLKPDFTATFSRGVLRLTGTFGGLLLATVLVHLIDPGLFGDVILIALFMYALRSVGPANYGIFVVSITGMIVLLMAMTGIPPTQVVAARALNTTVGGVLALAVYWAWPTWERTQVGELFAQMLDTYRLYYREIAQAYKGESDASPPALDRPRLDARLARSNVEASVDRLSAEPGVNAAQLALLTAMLASSHRLIHAFMALEAGLHASHPAPPREASRTFAADVELTLYFMAAALRGSTSVKGKLPDLREDHRKLVHSGDPMTERYALVNVEADRVTNSLNTLAEQVFRFKSMQRYSRSLNLGLLP